MKYQRGRRRGEMADIQKCLGETGMGENIIICMVREKCYRYTAPANELWQSYGPPAPDFESEKGCGIFYER